MPNRINISSGSPWEDQVGYSRAVRMGNQLEISGTVAQENGSVVGKGDAYLQTVCILEKIKSVMEQSGGTLQNVIRTRMFVTDIGQWPQIAQAHSEYFGEVKPATTMVEVSKLIDPDYLVEIEVTAWL